MGNTGNAATAQKLTRKQMKAAIRARSYSERRAWWAEQVSLKTLPRNECLAEIRAIDKALAKIDREVPSERWGLDVRINSPGAGGEWPPADMPPVADGEQPPSRYEITKMVRAYGERRYYPASYITTSGHSYDVHLQRIYLRSIQHLMPDEGYRGSVVTVYDLHPRDRVRIRDREASVQRRGQYRAMTGIL